MPVDVRMIRMSSWFIRATALWSGFFHLKLLHFQAIALEASAARERYERMVMRSELADGPGDRVFDVKPRVNVISASLTVPALA